MAKIELTNMVMIQNPENGQVLVQNRTKSWTGLSFPGGHVEGGESLVDSAIREAKEETGLTVSNLVSCGVVHWANQKTFERYMVFLYRTCDYEGQVIEFSDEGTHQWMELDELKSRTSGNRVLPYLPLFLENRYSEAFGPWVEGQESELYYK